jgi:hypothetical protein
MTTITAKFQFERETKGAVRFQELVPSGQEGVINTLYIRKTALAGQVPTAITVTLEA